MFALAPPRRHGDRDGPAVRPRPGGEESCHGRSENALHFHCARGFRRARRLANMLDSLVRVSRRVRRGADRFATDPELPHGSAPAADQPGSRDTLRAVRPRPDRPTRGPAPSPRGEAEAAACNSSVRRRASEPGDCNTGATEAAPATFPRDFWPPTDRSWRSPRGKGALRGPRDARHRPMRIGRRALRAVGRVEFREATMRSHRFASERFHVLLNSLFKVLFNFPSRYLSAIGLVSVFSLRWSLPPTLGCIPKQPDS